MRNKNKAIIAASLIGAFTFVFAGCSGSITQTNTTTVSNESEVGTITETSANTTGSYTQISQEEAMEMMKSGTDIFIADVRTQSEYDTGHIPDAICIPNESIDENVINILPDKEQTILVYCRSGNRSKQASEKLARLGYTNVYEFGGINSWTGEIVQ